MRTINILTASLLCFAACTAASAQSSPAKLEIGTVALITPAPSDQVFELELTQEQGVIVDLTPVSEPESAGSFPSSAVLRVVGPDKSCIRAMPSWEGCPTSGSAPGLEQSAGLDTSRIAFRAEKTGTYRLTLSAPPDPAVERYELLVRERTLPEPIHPQDIKLCEESPPEDAKADPCAKTFAMGEAGRAYFKFETKAPDQWLLVDMRSDALDSVVELVGPLAGRPVEQAPQVDWNDDSGGTLNAQLRSLLPEQGLYVVVASSFSGGTGDFTLAVRALPAPEPRVTQRLTLGVALPDNKFVGNELEPYHTFELPGLAGQTIVIEVNSPLDTTLEAGFEMNVFNEATRPAEDFAVLASDDDSCGLNPQLRLRFEEDKRITLRVGVAGSTGSAGAYTILARVDDGETCVLQSQQEGAASAS